MTNKPKIKVINTNNENITKMTASKESEKYFVHRAVLDLLEKEDEK